MKKAFTVLELLLVLSILTVLFSLVLFVIRPEDIFEDSDAVKIANDKVDIQTAYTKYRLDNEGDSPFEESLVPGIVYKICKEEVSDCDTSNFEVSINELKSVRLLKEVPVHPILGSDRYTGYVISETGGAELLVIDEQEIEYNPGNTPPGECFMSGGDSYCVVEGTDGVLWLDRDLGADTVATSPTDTSAYGDLYQWGRSKDGHQIRTSTVDSSSGRSNSLVPSDDFLSITSSPYNWYSGSNPDNLWQGAVGANNPCPLSWRLPTRDEWITEMAGWSSQDLTGGYNSNLKLVAGGRRDNAGTLQDVGSIGHYWSYTNNSGQDTAKSIRIGTSTATNNNDEERVEALAVRCIKDTQVIVTNPSNSNETANYNLVSDSVGRCTGNIFVDGTFVQSSPLTSNEKVNLSVFVASPGTYSITTDTINGYTFLKSGTFTQTGNTVVTLDNNGGTPISSGTDTFTANAVGIESSCTFQVEVGGSGSCSSISIPGTPTGTTSVTQGTAGLVYSVTAVSGADSYVWDYTGTGETITAGQGTNSITVSYGYSATSGSWRVKAINNNSPASCNPQYETAYGAGLNITLVPPVCSSISTPGTPSGPSGVTQGTNGHVYSVTAVSGADGYEWDYTGTGDTITAGSNTNIITVSYSSNATSGSWRVRAINNNAPTANCTPVYTTSYSANRSVTVSPPVCGSISTPSTPTGPTLVVRGSTNNVYSVSAVGGADSYEWDYTGTGDTITAGQGTNSITVTYASNATAGSWRVRATNNNSPQANCTPVYTTSYSSGLTVQMDGWNNVKHLNAYGGYLNYDAAYGLGGNLSRRMQDRKSIATGENHTCVLRTNGNVTCYGDNSLGQSAGYAGGDGIGISAGQSHTCVLRSNGNVSCFGDNTYGQSAAYTGGDGVGLSTGYANTCVLKSNGNVDCYGDNFSGQSTDYTGGDAVAVVSAQTHSCILRTNGNVNCYGAFFTPQLYFVPASYLDYTGGDAIGLGELQSGMCMLRTNGNIVCHRYQGGGFYTNVTYPGADALSVAGGANTAFSVRYCVLKLNGNVDCSNISDYLEGDAISLDVGFAHACVLKKNGIVDCFGDNSHGEGVDYTNGDVKIPF